MTRTHARLDARRPGGPIPLDGRGRPTPRSALLRQLRRTVESPQWPATGGRAGVLDAPSGSRDPFRRPSVSVPFLRGEQHDSRCERATAITAKPLIPRELVRIADPIWPQRTVRER